MPSGVVTVIYIVIAIWYNRKYGNTLYVAMVLLGFSILGLVLLLAIPLEKAKLLGLYLCWSFVAAYTMLLVSLANNVSGYTKKIFYSSCLIVLYTVNTDYIKVSFCVRTDHKYCVHLCRLETLLDHS